MTNSERNSGKVSILFSLMSFHLWLMYCKVNKIISKKKPPQLRALQQLCTEK